MNLPPKEFLELLFARQFKKILENDELINEAIHDRESLRSRPGKEPLKLSDLSVDPFDENGAFADQANQYCCVDVDRIKPEGIYQKPFGKATTRECLIFDAVIFQISFAMYEKSISYVNNNKMDENKKDIALQEIGLFLQTISPNFLNKLSNMRLATPKSFRLSDDSLKQLDTVIAILENDAFSKCSHDEIKKWEAVFNPDLLNKSANSWKLFYQNYKRPLLGAAFIVIPVIGLITVAAGIAILSAAAPVIGINLLFVGAGFCAGFLGSAVAFGSLFAIGATIFTAGRFLHQSFKAKSIVSPVSMPTKAAISSSFAYVIRVLAGKPPLNRRPQENLCSKLDSCDEGPANHYPDSDVPKEQATNSDNPRFSF